MFNPVIRDSLRGNLDGSENIIGQVRLQGSREGAVVCSTNPKRTYSESAAALEIKCRITRHDVPVYFWHSTFMPQ